MRKTIEEFIAATDALVTEVGTISQEIAKNGGDNVGFILFNANGFLEAQKEAIKRLAVFDLLTQLDGVDGGKHDEVKDNYYS